MCYIGKFEYAEFDGVVNVSLFSPKTHFLGKCDLKNQRCLFQLKFGT